MRENCFGSERAADTRERRTSGRPRDSAYQQARHAHDAGRDAGRSSNRSQFVRTFQHSFAKIVVRAHRRVPLTRRKSRSAYPPHSPAKARAQLFGLARAGVADTEPAVGYAQRRHSSPILVYSPRFLQHPGTRIRRFAVDLAVRATATKNSVTRISLLGWHASSRSSRQPCVLLFRDFLTRVFPPENSKLARCKD